jgi:hypothetical protein
MGIDRRGPMVTARGLRETGRLVRLGTGLSARLATDRLVHLGIARLVQEEIGHVPVGTVRPGLLVIDRPDHLATVPHAREGIVRDPGEIDRLGHSGIGLLGGMGTVREGIGLLALVETDPREAGRDRAVLPVEGNRLVRFASVLSKDEGCAGSLPV